MPCPRRLNSGRSGVEPEGSESLWPPATPRGPPERPGPIPPLMKANPRTLATSSRRSGIAQPHTTQRPHMEAFALSISSERQMGCGRVRKLFTPGEGRDFRSYVEDGRSGEEIDPRGMKKATLTGLV